METETV